MQPPYNDRWERTKRYLLRNFLVNPGFRLSPIPEEERSSPDSDSLPDLVLEPAPNRHDHPPNFYEGLERRMKRYYRQLFLGGYESDDYSSDFEVNRSMASTFRLDIDARKDNEATIIADKNSIGDLDDSMAKKRKLTKSTNESFDDENESQDKYDDELIDTRAATYNDTRHVSADSKCSSVEDEENLQLIETRSINESIHSNKTDDPNVDIEDYGNNLTYDIDNQPGAARVKKSGYLNEINASKINEAKSDSEDAALCHRISTTVAEIHEIRPKRRSTQVFDNGSPVLIPRLLQFSRRVFGSGKSRESFNVSEASDEFIRRLSSHRSDASNIYDDIEEPRSRVRRLLAAGELTRASLDSDKLDTEHTVEYIETEDKLQDDANKHDIIEDRTDIEDIIQPHEITRTSVPSNETVDTEDIEDYVDTEGNKQKKDNKNDDIEDRTGNDDVIQPHEITRASLASNKSLVTESTEDYDDTEDITVIEDIIQPHEMTRASLDSNKSLDTENIENYVNTEENKQEDDDKTYDIEDRIGINDIIQPHEITRASLASNTSIDTEDIAGSVDTEENKQEDGDKTYDVQDKSQVSEIQTDNEGDNIDADVDETNITGIQNTSINWNEDGIDDDEDSFENALRQGLFARKARKMVFVSSSEESLDDLEPIAHSSAMSIDDEDVEVMREARESGGNERCSWHGEAVNQDSPALAFETQTNADKPENESSDSNEINASFEDDIAEDIEDPYNTTPHAIAKIVEFWSVSPEDVDIESPIELSRSNKRRTDSEAAAPTKRKKIDVAIQAGSEENFRKWEDVNTDFFVGSPLVFRLCGCQDHVCSYQQSP